MNKYKIAIPEMPIERSELPERILEKCDVIEGIKGQRGDNDVLLSMIPDADAIIVNSSNSITAELMQQGKKLKVAFKSGAWPENIDFDYAKNHNIAVGWTPAANAQSVAEYTVLMILVSQKKYIHAINSMTSGAWRNQSHIGRDIFGQTVGIVGIGGIGLRVAKILQAMGADIIAFDPFAKEEVFRDNHISNVSFDNLLMQSDIISIHCLLTDETKKMFNEQTFKKMKPSAILVNSARGGMIDEEALYHALTTDELQMAVLDVYGEEPLPMNHPLRTLDNVLLTPHVAARTKEAAYRECVWAIEGCLDYLEGNKINNAVIVLPEKN